MSLTKLDEKDHRVLRELQHNAGVSTARLAKKTGLPPTTVHNRIGKLKRMGVLLGLKARIDSAKAGRPISAYVLVTVNYPSKKFSQQETSRHIAQFEGVEEVAIVTGDTDILVKVRMRDTAELNDFLTKKLRALEGIDKTVTWVILQEFEGGQTPSALHR